jgi:hypothetical protein
VKIKTDFFTRLDLGRIRLKAIVWRNIIYRLSEARNHKTYTCTILLQALDILRTVTLVLTKMEKSSKYLLNYSNVEYEIQKHLKERDFSQAKNIIMAQLNKIVELTSSKV